jgi:hypothetical protein
MQKAVDYIIDNEAERLHRDAEIKEQRDRA